MRNLLIYIAIAAVLYFGIAATFRTQRQIVTPSARLFPPETNLDSAEMARLWYETKAEQHALSLFPTDTLLVSSVGYVVSQETDFVPIVSGGLPDETLLVSGAAPRVSDESAVVSFGTSAGPFETSDVLPVSDYQADGWYNESYPLLKAFWRFLQRLVNLSVSADETNETSFVSLETAFVSRGINTPRAAYYKWADRAKFFEALQAMCIRLRVQPDWMLNTMFAESGLNPQAVNSIGATGLIQFLPETALWLGTSTAALAQMTGTEQLPYVEAFYRRATGRIHSYQDLRLFTFFPAALGQSPEYVMEAPGLPASVVAARNGIFDLDADNRITVAEFHAKINE